MSSYWETRLFVVLEFVVTVGLAELVHVLIGADLVTMIAGAALYKAIDSDRSWL
jgi:hypothetical protein